MYRDPITGDSLTRKEFYTRQLQVFVRSPWFIAAFVAGTVLAILLHWLDGWNFFMSWLAIVLEWVVGTFMFGQTGRDAVYIRKNAKQDERIIALEERIALMEERILAKLETDGPERPQGRQDSVHREAAQES